MLEVKQLTKTYDGGKRSLQDVSFTAQPGEVTVIIGPSGAGKTTLLRSINQLITDDSGQIRFDDQDICALNKRDLKHMRSKIGMIFQNYNLIESLTTIENVLHGGLARKSTIAGVLSLYTKQEKEEAIQLIDEVGLKDFAFQYCSDLSGGQKQRVGIARSLMQHPEMILCDEPIASLDPKSTIIVMDILKKLAKKRGMLVLINLHQVDIAKEYADHIIGLNDGHIVFDGPADQASSQDIERIYRDSAYATS